MPQRKIVLPEPDHMFSAMEAFGTSAASWGGSLEGISSKREMAPRVFAYKFASLLDSQTAHHLRVPGPGGQDLCDGHILLGSFVKVLGQWSSALNPSKGLFIFARRRTLNL